MESGNAVVDLEFQSWGSGLEFRQKYSWKMGEGSDLLRISNLGSRVQCSHLGAYGLRVWGLRLRIDKFAI